MADEQMRRAAQVTKGPTDTISAKPREQPPTFHTATVVKVDLPQNTCDIQLNQPDGMPALVGKGVRLGQGYKPKVGDTCKFMLTHPVPVVISDQSVPDPYITLT